MTTTPWRRASRAGGHLRAPRPGRGSLGRSRRGAAYASERPDKLGSRGRSLLRMLTWGAMHRLVKRVPARPPSQTEIRRRIQRRRRLGRGGGLFYGVARRVDSPRRSSPVRSVLPWGVVLYRARSRRSSLSICRRSSRIRRIIRRSVSIFPPATASAWPRAKYRSAPDGP
jgi:hypothetical protein